VRFVDDDVLPNELLQRRLLAKDDLVRSEEDVEVAGKDLILKDFLLLIDKRESASACDSLRAQSAQHGEEGEREGREKQEETYPLLLRSRQNDRLEPRHPAFDLPPPVVER
jgi:hypothetical protein